MNENKNHINYTAADIQQYVQGKLSPQQMHAMEKAALDDPFLADAIEGMQEALQEHGEPAVSDQLQQFRNQVQTRTGKTGKGRVIAFRWWQAAAAATIVIVGALWIYNFSSNKDVLTVATQEKVPEAPQERATAADSAPVPASANEEVTSAKPEPAPTSAAKTSPSAKQQDAQAVAPANDHALTTTVPAPLVQEAAPPVAAKTDTTRTISANQFNDLIAQKEARQAFSKNVPPARESVAVNQQVNAMVKRNNDLNIRETELITIAKTIISQNPPFQTIKISQVW